MARGMALGLASALAVLVGVELFFPGSFVLAWW